MKGKPYLAGREEGQTMEEQEQQVLEAGGTLDETTFQEEVVEEAEKQGVELHDVKGELDAAEPQPHLPGITGEKVPTVKDNKMLVDYVRPHFSMDEEGRYCALEFSFPLTKDHKGKLPKAVEDAWRFVEKGGKKGVVGIELADQIIDIYLAADIEDTELEMGNVQIVKAGISVIQQLGKGASTRVVRFSFHAVSEVSDDLCTFAVNQFGNSVWIEMSQSQGELAL